MVTIPAPRAYGKLLSLKKIYWMWNWEIFNPICWKHFIWLHYSWFCSEVYWSLKSPSKFFLYILIWISQPSPHNLTFFWYIECVQFSSITIIFNVLRHTPNLPEWQLLPVNPTSHRHWYVSCPKSEDTECLNMDSFVKIYVHERSEPWKHDWSLQLCTQLRQFRNWTSSKLDCQW